MNRLVCLLCHQNGYNADINQAHKYIYIYIYIYMCSRARLSVVWTCTWSCRIHWVLIHAFAMDNLQAFLLWANISVERVHTYMNAHYREYHACMFVYTLDLSAAARKYWMCVCVQSLKSHPTPQHTHVHTRIKMNASHSDALPYGDLQNRWQFSVFFYGSIYKITTGTASEQFPFILFCKLRYIFSINMSAVEARNSHAAFNHALC